MAISQKRSSAQIKSDFKTAKENVFNEHPTYQQLNQVYQRIINQKMFLYKPRLIIRYFAKCLCLRSSKALKR